MLGYTPMSSGISKVISPRQDISRGEAEGVSHVEVVYVLIYHENAVYIPIYTVTRDFVKKRNVGHCCVVEKIGRIVYIYID